MSGVVDAVSDLTGMGAYIVRPLILLTVLGIVSGVVGVIVNLRRLEFNAEAVVHSVFPGIVAGAVFGGLDAIIPAASAVAIVVAFVLTVATRRSSEAGTAVVLTSFFSIGMIISLKAGDKSGQLEALMFGKLLEVTDRRLTEAVIVCLVALVIVVATWRSHIFLAFDRVGARATGLNLGQLDILINVAIAAVVVSSASAIGTLLVVGYLIVPGAAARLVSGTVNQMVAWSIAVGLISGYVGLWVSGLSPRISPQASVIMIMALLYAVLLCVSPALRRVVR